MKELVSKCLGKVFNQDELARIRTALAQEEGWQSHVNHSCYTGHWDVLALRCPAKDLDSHPILQCFSHEDPALSRGDAWANLPLLETRYPELSALFTKFKCPIKSIRFMRLHAGAKILPHCDDGVCLYAGEARLHIPIISSPDVNFNVAETEVPMREGELWYINAALKHRVTNTGNKERVHIVMDCVANHWLRNKVLGDSQNML